MKETESTSTNPISLLKPYLTTILSITILTVILYILLYDNYTDHQKKIVEIHQAYCDSIHTTISRSILVKDSSYVINDVVLEEIKDQQTSLKALLQLQYVQQQAGMNNLTLWAAVLTIVFLIFSIYALFKLEDIMKQGRNMLREAEDTQEEIKKKKTDIDSTLAKATKDIDEKVQEELKKVDGEIKKRNESIAQASATFQATYTKFSEEVQNLARATTEQVNNLLNTTQANLQMQSEAKDTEEPETEEETKE